MNVYPDINIESAEDLVRLVMTQHWDIQACPCTFCEAGRILGLHADGDFLGWRRQGFDYLGATPASPELAIAPWQEVPS